MSSRNTTVRVVTAINNAIAIAQSIYALRRNTSTASRHGTAHASDVEINLPLFGLNVKLTLSAPKTPPVYVHQSRRVHFE